MSKTKANKRQPVQISATVLDGMREYSEWSGVPLTKLVSIACIDFLSPELGGAAQRAPQLKLFNEWRKQLPHHAAALKRMKAARK